MMKSIAEFYEGAQRHVGYANAWFEYYRPKAIADHICYKCASSEEFEQMRTMLEKESVFVYQSIISNRRIAIIRLKNSIATTLGEVWFVELSDQKVDGSQRSEFDHIEIYPETGSMEDLVRILEEKGVIVEKVSRPHHTTFDVAIHESFKTRIEPEALIEKIIRDELTCSSKKSL